MTAAVTNQTRNSPNTNIPNLYSVGPKFYSRPTGQHPDGFRRRLTQSPPPKGKRWNINLKSATSATLRPNKLRKHS